MQNQCLDKEIVYQAKISNEQGLKESYVGMAATTFKARWSNHMSSIQTRNNKNATTLSRYIWDLQDRNIPYKIEWKLIGRGKQFSHISETCRLCIREKYFIIFKPEMASLNDRNEIAGHCPHKLSQLLVKS